MLFRERQQLVICVVAGVMVGGFVLFRYLPLHKKKKAIEQAKTAQMLAAVKALTENRELPVLKEQLVKLQEEVGDYEANVPAKRSLGEFLQRIAKLMNKHNLKEQLVQPGKEIESGELRCVPVSMQGKGRLKQIFEFYKSLQGLDRMVRIEQVKLSNDNGFSGEVSMQTRIGIYCRKDAGRVREAL